MMLAIMILIKCYYNSDTQDVTGWRPCGHSVSEDNEGEVWKRTTLTNFFSNADDVQ
jgi:hypothetical protein